MHNFLAHIHSGLRWIVLILLLAAIFKAIAGLAGKKHYTPGDKKLALFTLISVHTQLVIGIVLYILFMQSLGWDYGVAKSNAITHFFAMDHIMGMLVAIALITVGYSRAKRKTDDKGKFKAILIFFGIGLLLILGAIPWPFMEKFHGIGWF